MDTKAINLEKYNIPAPRYTSYPTVPYWQPELFSAAAWLDKVRMAATDPEGISLYVHLPYCESLCTYCGCNTRITVNHQVETPYIEWVLKEWDLYKSTFGRKIQIKDIHLGGGTPTFFSPENLKRLIDGLLKDTKVAGNAAFSFEAHPTNTTFAHLRTLYQLGFKRLSLGIQDFDPKVQHIINRKQHPDDVVRVVLEARALGYTSINFDLIYGLPLQTLSGLENTLELALGMHPDRIAFYSYAHVPWIKPGQRLFTEKDLPNEGLKWELYQAGKQRIAKSGYEDIGMDHFALPHDPLALAAKNGSLHRNFMGYTDRKSALLLGLGVSSISDAWQAYAQNAKTVEAYRDLLENGQLPIVKGHLLTDEDIQIRKQILAVMCQKKVLITDKPAESTWKGLCDLAEDGLIELNEDCLLLVTEKGKAFLRNICMAFDQRLARKSTDQPIFSKAI